MSQYRKQLCAGLLASVIVLPSVCNAGATVLPKGVYNLSVTGYRYGDITHRFNEDGETEPLGADYNGSLDSSVFLALQPLDPLVGGTATFGDAVVDFEYRYRTAEVKFKYGVTDKFTLTVEIPHFDAKNKVTARLDPTNANVGKNPLWESGFDPVGSPVVPLGTGIGETPLSTEDVLDIVSGGADLNDNGTVDVPGFGFDSFETWQQSGIGDIVVSGKYRFLERGAWAMAASGGVRFPTGQVDEPDSLVDLGFGGGQYDLVLGLSTDYKVFEDLLVTLDLGYTAQLPDKEVLRVPESVDAPVTNNKENVDRDLGDIVSVDIGAFYRLTQDWSAGLTYEFSMKYQDDVDGDEGFTYSSLEAETQDESQSVVAELNYSSVQRFLDKQARIPFTAGIAYRNRFAGKDNVNKSDYISAVFSLYFR